MDFRCVQGRFFQTKGDFTMEFFNSAVDVLKTLVVALGHLYLGGQVCGALAGANLHGVYGEVLHGQSEAFPHHLGV